MQEYPPEGLTDTNTHNIATYTHQIAERTSERENTALATMRCHRSARNGAQLGGVVSAKVGRRDDSAGPVHWARGLQAPVAFPYQRPMEASAMGGGGVAGQLRWHIHATGRRLLCGRTGSSYLDLYLMGLIAPGEVPDFFMLSNIVPTGKDANGHPIFKADRTKVTVQDVIAAEGLGCPTWTIRRRSSTRASW